MNTEVVGHNSDQRVDPNEPLRSDRIKSTGIKSSANLFSKAKLFIRPLPYFGARGEKVGRIVSVGRMVEEEVEMSTEAAVDMGIVVVDMVDMGIMLVGMNGATGVPITEPG